MSRIDLSKVVPVEAVHVGEVIKDELKARGMKQSELAGLIGVQRPILNDVIKGKRSLTPHMALLIGEAMDIPAEMLMKFQTAYELDCARISERVIRQKKYMEAWKVMKDAINVKYYRKKGIIQGNIVEDVNRLYEAYNAKNLDEFLTNINH
ncbi:MAG: HigA family addiction module antidote protein [Bacteroidales bacterium]|nr:HigA family addiction module antidote protein [Bacteroidales bacterium]